MKISYLYNFKNTIRYFINIDNLMFLDNKLKADINGLVWTEPFNFRVKKEEEKYRTLKIPNILNFKWAYEHYKTIDNFNNIQKIDNKYKRLSTNVETGDFVSGEYDRQLDEDFSKLCIYDNLIKVDIKEYYGRIYTHRIDFQNYEERYLSNMNLGATNGLIMGNYLSLYFAELNLSQISKDIETKILDSKIECEFSYFSDDFYFFCNKKNNSKIINIFDEVLEDYDLERNSSKKEIWTYESFNNYNLVAREWKKIIAYCNKEFKEDRDDNKLRFLNQIIYRMSFLESNKLKRVFINNFFKTQYFRNLELEKYKIKSYDYHQLCFILKYSPESILYIIDKILTMPDFDSKKIHKFLEVRYKEILKEPFNEEQLYYYYAIKLCGFESILKTQTKEVLESKNQVLISYYLKDSYFKEEELTTLKEKKEEKYWFQNYHLILYDEKLFRNIENNVEEYLIPKKIKELLVKKPNNLSNLDKRNNYLRFYSENLKNKKSLISDIFHVKSDIENYLSLKALESERNYKNNIK